MFTTTFVVYSDANLINTNAIVNGSTTDIIVGQTTNFNVDPLLGAITWILVIVILAGAVGINVVGSGLTGASAKMIVVGTAWVSAFILLSVYAFPFIVLIPYNLGSLTFILLTMIYAFGVFKQLSGGND
jgi:hypothetical protein